MNKRRNRNWTPMLIVAGAALVAAVVWAQNGRPGTTPSTKSAKSGDSAPTVSVALAATRKPLDYYTGGVRADLFVPPDAPAPVVKAEGPKLPAPTPVAVTPPLVDYGYTGSIAMGDQFVALVENVKTKEGQYLKVGDPFQGGTVSKITDRSVEVNLAGKTEVLTKGDDYKLVSLDRNAPSQTGQPGAPGMPGQPGMPGMGMPGMPPGMQMMMQNMTPEQRQQMQQQFQTRMLNRQFNGGAGGPGGGRRGNRGGGGFGGGGFGGGGFGGGGFGGFGG